jgi:hypothetical protein
VYYILAFAPSDITPEGKFHALTVTLAEKQKGFSIQARRGYFAASNEVAEERGTKEGVASNAVARPQDQVQGAILSKNDITELPVELDTKLSEEAGDKREISVFSRVDAGPLHFRKEGDHNFNTLTFVFAVFDDKGTLIEAQQRQAKVSVLDGQLPELFKLGVYVNLAFQLRPGNYRLREVVTDSEEHHMTTLSRNIAIP